MGTLGGCTRRLWSDHRLCQATTGEFSSVCKEVLSETDFLNWLCFSSPEATSAPHSPFTFSHDLQEDIITETTEEYKCLVQRRIVNNNIWKHEEGRMSKSSCRRNQNRQQRVDNESGFVKAEGSEQDANRQNLNRQTGDQHYDLQENEEIKRHLKPEGAD